MFETVYASTLLISVICESQIDHLFLHFSFENFVATTSTLDDPGSQEKVSAKTTLSYGLILHSLPD